MKIIKVIFFIFLALGLVACTAVFIFFQVFDTDQYLSQITQKASLALGRTVSIGHMGLGLSLRGITLDAWPLAVADDPDFTTQPFVEIDRVRLSPDWKMLILQRKIRIKDILLESPQIHFIRSKEGNFNVRSFGRAISSVSRVLASPSSSVIASPSSSVIARILSEAKGTKQSFTSKEIASSLKSTPRNDAIKSVIIQDASISFIDQNQAMPLDIWLNGINASLSDFAFFRLHADLSQLDIKNISAQMPNSPIIKNIGGQVQLTMNHLDGDINITGVVIKNFNIFKTVLAHELRVFGDMDGVAGKLGIGANDTIIEKAEAKFSLHDKTLFINDSLIQTNIFEFTAKGSLDQALNMDMQTTLHLNPDVSAVLINELGGLKYLCDDSKRITVDADIKGVIPHLKYKPNKDFRKKSKKVLMEEGGNILGILLGGR